MPMRNGGAGAYEFAVHLEDPNDLFEPRPADVERGSPPEEPGIQRIRDELDASRRGTEVTVEIVLPADKATPEVERGVRRAIARYCEAGIARAEHDLKAIHRDGWRTFLFGAVVLAVGLLLSEAVLRERVIPKELRDFFGNGLFLVVAWVGLWYPLDTLAYGGQPYRHERKLLRALSQVEILVRPGGGEPSRGVGEPAALADQSLTGG